MKNSHLKLLKNSEAFLSTPQPLPPQNQTALQEAEDCLHHLLVGHFQDLNLKQQFLAIEGCVLKVMNAMTAVERIAKVENQVSNMSEKVTEMSAQMSAVGKDVMEIKILLAKQAGAKGILNWVVNIIIGVSSALAGLFGAKHL